MVKDQHVHSSGSYGMVPAQRCGGSSYKHEQTGFKNRNVGLFEAEVLARKTSHKRRGSTLLQKPHEFMDALAKTKIVTDIIRQPTKVGAGYKGRLEHRLEHLVGTGTEDEDEIPLIHRVKELRLEKMKFATIHRADGKDAYCLNFTERVYPCKLVIEIWSATNSNSIRFYVSRSEPPTPANFDWWSPGNASISIGIEEAPELFGKYWITVVAMGPEARYMIKSFCQILRPQIETPHDKAAEKMVKLAVQERVKTSNVRMAASRGSTKPLQAQFREQFRALSNPIQVLPATSSLSPTGSNLTSKKSAAHGQMSDGRVHAEHTPASRRQDAKDKIALDSTMWDKPDVDELCRKCDFYEKRFMKDTLEPCSMQSRVVSVENSLFNPSKLRKTIALIHQVSSASKDNKESHESGKLDPNDICEEFIKRNMLQSIDAVTRSTCRRLVGKEDSDEDVLVSGSPGGVHSPPSPVHLVAHHRPRSKAQWAVSTEDPRIRKMVGREGLPRRLAILSKDAIDYRTHSFQFGSFRLSRVGALEMSTDKASESADANDVDYRHLAQIQELQSVDEVVLHDQPSSFYCFRLEFPPDQSQINARASASGNSQKIMSDLPVVITLAAFSTEDRTRWLQALKLFCELAAAERLRAARRAAAKKRQRRQSRSDMLASALTIGTGSGAALSPTGASPTSPTLSNGSPTSPHSEDSKVAPWVPGTDQQHPSGSKHEVHDSGARGEGQSRFPGATRPASAVPWNSKPAASVARPSSALK